MFRETPRIAKWPEKANFGHFGLTLSALRSHSSVPRARGWVCPKVARNNSWIWAYYVMFAGPLAPIVGYSGRGGSADVVGIEEMAAGAIIA